MSEVQLYVKEQEEEEYDTLLKAKDLRVFRDIQDEERLEAQLEAERKQRDDDWQAEEEAEEYLKTLIDTEEKSCDNCKRFTKDWLYDDEVSEECNQCVGYSNWEPRA